LDSLRQFLFRLAGLFRRRRWEAEMAEEVRHHLERRTREKLDEGLTPEEARCAAQREFGGVAQVLERCRDERRLVGLEQVSRDARHAARSLLKAPGFTVVALLTLALGIGANTALFSTFNTLVLHPLSFPEPGRLVRLWTSNPAVGFNDPLMSWTRYEFIRDHQKSFSNLAAATYTGFTVTRPDSEPEDVNTIAVTASFFPTLGVRPARGRSFTAEEDTPGGPKVAMLSYEYWQRAFGGRESVVGESIRLNDEPYVVVGITPRALSNPYGTVLLFVPRAFEQRAPAEVRRGLSFLETTARLKPGVTPAQAAGEIAALAKDYRAAFPGNSDAQDDTPVKLFADELVGDLRPTFYLLLAAVGFVLLIACANIAALFLGRLSARHREIAVRLSLGATRRQLVRQFLVESALFSAGAGAVGVLVASGALAAIQQLAASQLPAGVTLGLDRGMLAYTVGVSALSMMFVGLVPALQASRADVADALKDSARGSSGGTRGTRFRSTLVVGEVTLSVVLLVLSGLLLTSFGRMQRASAGFNPHGIATALVSLPPTRYKTGPQQIQFYGQLVERLEAQPHVQGAALAIGAPLTGFQPRRSYAVGGRPVRPAPERPLASLYLVTEHYFATMQIPLRAGRGFDARDDGRAPRRCIINESFARRLFPGESALGKVLLRGPNADERCEIIGVSADVKSAGLTAAPPDEMYFSLRQYPWQLAVLLVRTDGDPRALQPVIGSAVAGIDRNQPIASFAPYDSLVAESLGTPRLAAWLTGVFAAVALLLSAVGLYSVLAYGVTQRTGEIGIRIALGARRGQVISLVLRGGLKLVALGLALGLAAAAGASRLIQSLFFAVQPLDPVIYGGVAALFAVIAVFACLLPSWRASRIDPIITLRGE
jgi:predicted permease